MSSDTIMNLVSFVLGIVAFVMGLRLKKLVPSRLPLGRLKQTRENIREARTHVQQIIFSHRIPWEQSTDMHRGINGLQERYDELWLEVDRWTAMGWKRLVHPAKLKEILSSCSDLLKCIAAVRVQLRQQAQTSPVDYPDIHPYPPMSPHNFRSKSTAVSSLEALTQHRRRTYERDISSSNASPEHHPTTWPPEIPQFYFYPLMADMPFKAGGRWAGIPDGLEAQDITDALRG